MDVFEGRRAVLLIHIYARPIGELFSGWVDREIVT